MALDSWLFKVKSAIANSLTKPPDTAISIPFRRKSHVGILAFEIATLMSKLLHLWRSLSEANISHLRHESIALEGVRKIVSDDDAFLLGLACAELTDTLRSVAESISAISHRCSDPALRQFEKSFLDFADSGYDPNSWSLTWKEMDTKACKMDRHVASTAALYKEMDELVEAEHALRRLLQSGAACNHLSASKISSAADAQQKVFWQRQEVKHMKQSSLWSTTVDAAVSLLARASFTVLARIKNIFVAAGEPPPSPHPHSISLSTAVHPSSDKPAAKRGFFETSTAMLSPPESTLGAAGMALHYANVIVLVERMIRAPRAVGPEARDGLYGMLPATVRGLLRARLRRVGWGAARDGVLAAEWRAALWRIMGWLGPVAHGTLRWQGERSFERWSAAAPRANVLLLQTLYFANREKVEAAVTELLVGLNYVWRFEIAMSVEALEGLVVGMQSDYKCVDS